MFYGKGFSKKVLQKRYSSKRPKSIMVSSSDTAYSIAKKYNISLRDLITRNNLSAPYFLKKGQRIIIPASKYHKIKSGDTLYGISRKHGMNINKLIALNSLQAPYSIKVGKKLLVSGSKTSESSSIAYSKSQRAKSSPQKIKRSKYPKAIKVANKNNRFSWPIRGTIISKFGPKAGGLYNDGINIKAKSGGHIKSTEDGVVAYVGDELRGYGNLIIIKHAGGWISAYGHLSSTNVKRGANVKKGQIIAKAGSTGNVKSTQLYFGLRKGREAVNPQKYL
ncbi:MAG: murein DD-endopeptidase MepM/ murein hydrolase activator NlpD [Rickettsiales bacterium]|jgi:murein DD-endopeptidase MepM/ murein hydrolase activator NlpD